MIQKIAISPGQVNDYICMRIEARGALNGFPFLAIDRDSYLVGVDVQSGINFDPTGGRHCIAIGKGCSLAESITFMIDLNHDYASVCQGELSFLRGCSAHSKAPRKGTIILQNDVWVGHGATIMAGVTLHFAEPFPLYPKILEQYFAVNRPGTVLLIYLSKEDTTPANLGAIQAILQRYEDCDCDVVLQTGEGLEEHTLFQYADYYVTTRSRETVFRTCLADLHQTKILYGTDDPIFWRLEESETFV